MKKSLEFMSVLVVAMLVVSGLGYIMVGAYSLSSHKESGETSVISNIEGNTLGTLVTSGDTVYITGTYVINQTTIDPLTGQRGRYGFDSNVVVESTGKLVVENATVYFLSDVNHRYSLTVKGSLYFYNATFTIAHGLIQPYYPFEFNIAGPSAGKVEIVNSRLLYPGWFNVTNRNGNVIIENTIFDKMGTTPTDYPAPPRYGPTPYFAYSTVYIYKSKFESLFTNQTGGYRNIGWINDTTTYNVGTSSGAVINNFVENPVGAYSDYWNYAILKNLNILVDYTNSSGYQDSSSFVIMYDSTKLVNALIQGKKGGSGQLNLSVDMSSYLLTPTQFYEKLESGEIKVYVTNTTNGSVSINRVVFNIGIEKNLIKYGINKFSFNIIQSTLYMRDVYVDADYQSKVDLGVSHHMFYMDKSSTLYALNLTVNDTGKQARYDTAFLMKDTRSKVYILRYGVTEIYFRNIPIDGLKVSATPYPVDISSNTAIVSEMMSVINNYVIHTSLIPNMKIGNVKVTGNYVYDFTKNGVVNLPLLSDIINQTEVPNSKFVGIYKVSVENATKTFYRGEIGLGYYPWLSPTNNTQTLRVELSKYKDVDIGVKGVSVTNEAPYLPGRNVEISVSIENYGKDMAENVTLYVYVNGIIYEVQVVGNIGGGMIGVYSYEITGGVLSSNGVYNISVEAVQEWDYNLGNNEKSVIINVGSIEVSEWNVGKAIRYHYVWVNMSISSVYSWSNVGVELYLDNLTTMINSTTTYLGQGTTQISFGWYVSGNVSAGSHVLLLYLSNGVFIGSYSINVEEDVDLEVASLQVTPQQCYVGETITIKAGVIDNGKELPSSAVVYINLYDPLGTIIENKSFAYSPTTSYYTLTILPNMAGQYIVTVKVVAPGDYNMANNVLSKIFNVYTEPFTISASTRSEYVNGTSIVVNVTITSNVDANVTLVLYIPSWNVALNPATPKNPIALKSDTPILVAFVIPKSLYQKYLKGRASITVSYRINVTSDVTGDARYVHTAREITIKEKTNFVLTYFYIMQGDKQVVKVPEGVKVSIHFVARNYGGMPGELEYVILDNGKPLVWGKAGVLEPGSYKVISFNYTVSALGKHNITVKLNPNGTVEESIYGDDMAVKELDVLMPVLKIQITSYSMEHNEKIYVGDTLVVVVKIINMNATESLGKTVYMKGVTVKLTLTGGLGTYTQTTNQYGIAIFHIKVAAAGTYKPELQLNYQGTQQTYIPQGLSITVEKKPFTIPWLWIIIIVIVVAVAGFFLYGYITFKKEAPEYMVCGNCGHLIPADAERCPYCGVVFEKEKVKCPECGSWIDEDSKFCPVCGTIFIPPEDPEYKKYTRLKENYEKYIAKYKEEAKKYIGEEYTTEEFFKWWKTHPEFISFLEWVKRQEEKIEGDTVKCPVCGSLNPKGAKICRVCGSPLPVFKEEKVEKEEPKIQEKPSPISKEELERLKRPGVVTVEEWAEKKEKEKKTEEPKKEQGEKKKEEKPVVKKKVIKKVIAVKKKEEE